MNEYVNLLRTCRKRSKSSKTEGLLLTRDKHSGTCLLAMRWAVPRRHDLDTGICTERWNLRADDKGVLQAAAPQEESTDAVIGAD